MDIPWQLCRTIGPLTLHSQEMEKLLDADKFSLFSHFSELSDLGCLGECTALERLNLSKNDISKLHALAGLTNLVYLNLSANRIQALGKGSLRAWLVIN